MFRSRITGTDNQRPTRVVPVLTRPALSGSTFTGRSLVV